MLNALFRGIFDTASDNVIPVDRFLLCILISLICGAAIAWTASRPKENTRSFLSALAALPALVCVTIMMVNGNIGAGVATAGAFSLVRFRSGAGTAKEIALIFMSMVSGLIAGMGYLAYAVLFTLVLCGVLLLMRRLDPHAGQPVKTLRITVPEDLDYDQLFESLLAKYCASAELQQVRTTNMGSLFRLTYQVTLRQDADPRAMINELRCHNGNLEISLAHGEAAPSEL